MEYNCDLCGKGGFKSAAGLAGHKQLVHAGAVKRELPDNEVFANHLETALDGIGELREGLANKLATIAKALETLRTMQEALMFALKHENVKPTRGLLDHWRNCDDCHKELGELSSQLADMLPVPAPTPPSEPLPKRWKASAGGRYVWSLSGFGRWDGAETSDPNVAQEWREGGYDVKEIEAPAPPEGSSAVGEAAAEEPGKWWDKPRG